MGASLLFKRCLPPMMIMKKMNYIIPQTEVIRVNSLLMQQLEGVSGPGTKTTTDPEFPTTAPKRNKVF